MSDRLELAGAAREAPDTPAWIDAHGALTYRELAARVAARADALKRAGLEPERHRALLTPSGGRGSLITLLALLELRAPLVLAHPRWSAEEHARVRARTGAHLVTGERVEPPEAEVGPGPQGEPRPAVVVFTSGTSGTPKGVCLSRSALLAACEAHEAALPFRASDRWLLAMPLAHVGGLGLVLRCLHARRTVVRGPERFDPDAVLRELRHHSVTLASLVPTMLARLLPRQAPETLRAVLVGGAYCPSPLLAAGRAAGWPLLPTYGLSECCAQVCTQRLEAVRASGVGPPLPGVEVRVREGAIEVRGATRMVGFWGEAPMAPAAWYATGDAGRIDEEGHLHVLGRLDERIVTGGENVDPLAVEEALRAHPAVRDACVVGVDDSEWGQRVSALIVPEGAPPSPETLRAHLSERIASFAQPRAYRFVDELPLTPAGKLDRRGAQGMD